MIRVQLWMKWVIVKCKGILFIQEIFILNNQLIHVLKVVRVIKFLNKHYMLNV